MKISGVIITLNEEKNIAECIKSMQGLVDEILVVDSYSTDNTISIAEGLGARIVSNHFEGHIQQKNFAMEQAKYDYVLSLDADERVSDLMKASIESVKDNWQADGYRFNRLNNYCGSWLKNSWYPDAKIRLWDRRIGKWSGENPHDKVMIKSGKVQKLDGDIIHFAYNSVEEHLSQIIKFAVIAANQKFNKGVKVNFFIHVIVGPIFKFLKRYILKRGFLDGYYGFVFSVLSAFLNFVKYLKLWSLYRNGK